MSDSSNYELDIDVFGPEYVQEAPKVWKRLRSECPVAHTSLNGGGWLPTTYGDISSIAYDTENFSSRDIGVAATPEGVSLLVAPPITSDPPFHTDARRMLLPYFSPKAVEEMREVTRSIAVELLDAIDPSDVIDAAEQYARYIPVRVIGAMIGLPEEDCEMFTRWATDILQSHPEEEWERLTTATKEILEYFEKMTGKKLILTCFVDDLDRCLNGENVKVLEAVTLMLQVSHAVVDVISFLTARHCLPRRLCRSTRRRSRMSTRPLQLPSSATPPTCRGMPSSRG